MAKFSVEEIQHQFEFASEFNDIFDAFEQALELRLDDLELYKKLFWNKSLSADEVALFGEQLVKQFPALGFDAFMWLAEMCALTRASEDNFESAMNYFQKAATVRPDALEPYVKAVLCYDPDVKIPPAKNLIEFVKTGIPHVSDPRMLYQRLAYLYDQLGNDEMTQYYRRLGGESSGQ
ncbi:MAG: hypothetical protein HY960_07110 [Ignavibacteriae bacterium]|nr:hypothetical protein [Ignavibacteriota bacterium]